VKVPDELILHPLGILSLSLPFSLRPDMKLRLLYAWLCLPTEVAVDEEREIVAVLADVAVAVAAASLRKCEVL
jgi:hypothetical protein